jgi:hypothetical protein
MFLNTSFYISPEISSSDALKLSQMITHLQGQLKPKDEADYIITLESSNFTNLILPHYIHDVYKCQTHMPLDLYRFPDPPILTMEPFDLLNLLSKQQQQKHHDNNPCFLQNHVLFLENPHDSLIPALTAAGCRIVYQYSDDVTLCALEFRSGPIYIQAEKDSKMLGNMYWLQDMLDAQKIFNPKSKLIHYPLPPVKIPLMKDCYITCTGYSGSTRKNIERMCIAMGATFTKFLTNTHSHLIAAAECGEKYTKATQWNIHIVNILWLEQCFQHWTYFREARPPFLVFNRDLDFRLPVINVEDSIILAEKEMKETAESYSKQAKDHDASMDTKDPENSLDMMPLDTLATQPPEKSDLNLDDELQTQANQENRCITPGTPIKKPEVLTEMKRKTEDAGRSSRKRVKQPTIRILFTSFLPTQEQRDACFSFSKDYSLFRENIF